LATVEVRKNISFRAFSSTTKKKVLMSREVYLDTLARLLTGKETCAAFCYHGGKLFVASNEKQPRYAKTHLEILRNLVNNNQFSQNYEKLLELAVENTLYLEKKKSEPKDKIEENSGNFLKILKSFAKLFYEVKKLEADNNLIQAKKKWKYLINLHDTWIISSAIKSKTIEKEMLNLLLMRKK